MTYVLIDEIERVREFPRVLASLLLREGLDLYVTCSEDFVAGDPMATILTGRYVEIRQRSWDPESFEEQRMAAMY